MVFLHKPLSRISIPHWVKTWPYLLVIISTTAHISRGTYIFYNHYLADDSENLIFHTLPIHGQHY